MGRPRQALDGCQQAAVVIERLKHEPAGWRRERLRAVKFGLEGELNLDAVAQAIGRSRSVIQIWFDRYRQGGVEALLTLGRGKGPESLLTPEHEEFLRAGLAQGRWRTAEPIHQALAERGLKVKLSAIYHYLKKCEARLRVPRPCHLKKDPAAAEAFKLNLAEKLAALGIEPGRPVRVWIMDEMRCGLHTQARRVWGLAKVRPVVTVQQKYQWQYVYGALEVGGGRAQFWYAPTVNLDCNQGFLEQLGALEPESVHVVVYDGAGFHHRDGHAALPANVRIITLPPYSPELNPVEKLWDRVRDAICNRVFGTLSELEEALSARLADYWRDTAAVLSLLGNGWLLAQTNATGLSVLPM